MRILDEHGRGSFEGDLAAKLLGQNTDAIIDFIDACSRAKDADFLTVATEDPELPKFMCVLLAHVFLKQRG